MDRNRVVLILLVAAAIVSSLWFFGGSGAAGRPNLLLITLDTTRADRLGCYGYGPALTPALDHLSRTGVTFDQAIANAPLTLPSHATMLTGLLPPEHGLRVNGYGRLPGEVRTLARIAGEADYQTGAFVAAFVLDKKHGLNDGFDVYDDDLSGAYEVHAEDTLCEYRAGNLVVDRALSWLGQRDERPFFCWVHLYDPHQPYHTHDALAGTRFAGQGSYDSEIAFADVQVKRLLSFLQQEQLLANTLVVAVGDHGESLGEHGEDAHGYMLYESTLHVPMIFSMPGRIPQGRRVGALVSLVDLFPTLVSFLDLESEVEPTGRSLVAALSGNDVDSSPVYSETYQPFTSFGWSPLCSLTTPEWKYIRSSSVPRVFDRAADRGELRSLASVNAEKREELAQQLGEFEASLSVRSATAIELDDESKKRLEALGYVTGGEDALPAEGVDFALYPDIEEVLPALKLQLEMFRFQREGKTEEAERVRREMLAIVEVGRWRRHLGEGLIEGGRVDEGVAELRKYLASNPEAKDVRFNIAVALEKADRLSEAIAELTEIVQHDVRDLDAWGKLGQLLQNQGRLDEALEKFLKALEIKAEGRTHYNLALIYEQKSDYEKALDHYAEARALDPDFLDVPQNLGELFVRRGMKAEAVEYFQAAVNEAPQDPSRRLDLASAHEKLGDLEKAAAETQKAIDLAPEDVRGLLLLGTIRGKQNQLDRSLELLRKAAELDPQNVSVLNNLGLVLGRSGDFDEARTQFLKAIEIQPTNHIANRNLGDSYFREQEWDKAAEHYRTSILAEPNDADARRSYGHTLHAQKKYVQAAEQFAEAARINPEDTQARALRGGMLEAAGDFAGAVAEYRVVLKASPDQIAVLNNLAWILATHPDDAIRSATDAFEFADRARLLTHSSDAGILDTLAAAHAENLRFDQAVKVAQRALELADGDRELALVRANDHRKQGDENGATLAEAESAAHAQLAREIQERQELYRMEQPYRQPSAPAPAE